MSDHVITTVHPHLWALLLIFPWIFVWERRI